MAIAAHREWPGNKIPIFRNNKENLKKLDCLVAKLVPECKLDYFGESAIRKHIIDTLTERRRNVKKGYDYENVSLRMLYIHV